MPARAATSLFAVLFVLMVLNFIDRQIVVSMFPHLGREFELTDRELGAIVSIVGVAIALFTVPVSVAADRYGRLPALVAMVLLWSLATIACAFAGSLAHLVVGRAIVGAGEAAFGAVGAAMLASVFPARMRGTILAAFFSAALLGAVLGVALGGILAERWGWRVAFAAAGAPGVVMAFMLVAVARHGPGEPRIPRQQVTLREIAAGLRQSRTLPLICIASGLQLVTVSAIYAWLPSYLRRSHDIPPGEAGTRAALVILAAGVGTILWGALADRLDRRRRAARLEVPAVLSLATAAAFVVAFAWTPPGSAQFGLMLLGATLMTSNIGTANAAVIDFVPLAFRASAVSVPALAHNLVGLSVGPLVAGWISDRHGLGPALAIVSVASVFAAVAFAAAARAYPKDRVRSTE